MPFSNNPWDDPFAAAWGSGQGGAANNPWTNPQAAAYGNQQPQQQIPQQGFQQGGAGMPQGTQFNLNQHLAQSGAYAPSWQSQLMGGMLSPAINMNAYAAPALGAAYGASALNNVYANPAFQQARGNVQQEQVRQQGQTGRLSEALPLLMSLLGQFGGAGGAPSVSTNYGAGARFSGGT